MSQHRAAALAVLALEVIAEQYAPGPGQPGFTEIQREFSEAAHYVRQNWGNWKTRTGE